MSYLHDKDDNSIVNQSLQISVELYKSGQNSSHSNLMKQYLFDFNYNSLSDLTKKKMSLVGTRRFSTHVN